MKYKTIDVRKLESKNRVVLSDYLYGLLGEPEKVVFSTVKHNGEPRVVLNNPHTVIGDEIGRATITEQHNRRMVIPKKALEMMPSGIRFVGFFEPYEERTIVGSNVTIHYSPEMSPVKPQR